MPSTPVVAASSRKITNAAEPQALEGNHRRSRRATGHGDPAHDRLRAPRPGQAATTNTCCCGSGKTCATSPAQPGALPRLRKARSSSGPSDLYNKRTSMKCAGGRRQRLPRSQDFMRMIMPSHARTCSNTGSVSRCSPVQCGEPARCHILPAVTLPSGGYLVINPTEALVSDRRRELGPRHQEHNIEDTALQTNLGSGRGNRASCACATWPASSSSASSAWSRTAPTRRLGGANSGDRLKNDRARIRSAASAISA